MKNHLLLPVFVVAVAVFAMTKASSSKVTSDITFTRDVAPILFKNCADCHRPTGVAPMSFLSFKEVRPWARSVKGTSC
jgi:hypothetical protein